ncbi:MAG TPA: hypothetical protein VLS51_06160, partial [Propionibacteriaceae bacterium]|nr:hypothetical protein [Propionibacteriaceae bacterium]
IALRALMGYALVLGRRVATAPPAQPATQPTPSAVVPGQVPESSAADATALPSWHPDEAAGVVWRSAADAATGAPGGSYGSAPPRSGPPVWTSPGDVTRGEPEPGQGQATPR